MATSASETRPRRIPARERLLQAADRLFYEEGIGAVGIDRVLAESGTAKGSLYYNFAGKDELVAAYLRARHGRWNERIQAGLAAAGEDPVTRILSVFDTLSELFSEPNYKGCAFMNASAEARPDTPESAAIDGFRAWLHDLFRNECVQLVGRDADALTRKLVVIYDGASATSALDRCPEAARDAREIAKLILR